MLAHQAAAAVSVGKYSPWEPTAELPSAGAAVGSAARGASVPTEGGASKSKQLPTNIPSAQDFLEFFIKKVEAVRKATGGGPAMTFLPPATPTINCFQLYTDRR